jgi:molybdopterin converting factor small subunit
MKITITCYAKFKDIFGEVIPVEVPDNATISDAVAMLAKSAGPDADLLISSEGIIKDYVMIMHQGVRILPIDAGTISLTEGDTLIIFPPVSGG